VQVSYAIVFVSDMQASVAFYRDVLGMPLRFESPNWSELATGGATPSQPFRHQSRVMPAR
jgi:catechol 2,3-dioxygenase-like lactoylglutathione lyase family enzyme